MRTGETREKERWQILVLFRLGVNVNLSVGYVAMSVNLRGIIEQSPCSNVDSGEILGERLVRAAARINVRYLWIGGEKGAEVES